MKNYSFFGFTLAALIAMPVKAVAVQSPAGSAKIKIQRHSTKGQNMIKNKQIMPHFVEFINTASEKLALELVSPDAVFYVPGRPDPVRGPSGYLEIIAMMRAGFPDIQWTLEETIAEGDMVAARFTMRGTHTGVFFGAPPTGRKIEVQAMNFYRFSGRKIIAERGQPDLLGLMQQIGAIPM